MDLFENLDNDLDLTGIFHAELPDVEQRMKGMGLSIELEPPRSMIQKIWFPNSRVAELVQAAGLQTSQYRLDVRWAGPLKVDDEDSNPNPLDISPGPDWFAEYQDVEVNLHVFVDKLAVYLKLSL